jgi:hypothetical protein
MTTAKHFIGNFIALSNIANNNLFSLGNHHTVHSAGIVSSTRTAPAERFDLERVHAVG